MDKTPCYARQDFLRKATSNIIAKYDGVVLEDLNASINIKSLGLDTLGRSGINACGVVSIETTTKQEKECLVN